ELRSETEAAEVFRQRIIEARAHGRVRSTANASGRFDWVMATYHDYAVLRWLTTRPTASTFVASGGKRHRRAQNARRLGRTVSQSCGSHTLATLHRNELISDARCFLMGPGANIKPVAGALSYSRALVTRREEVDRKRNALGSRSTIRMAADLAAVDSTTDNDNSRPERDPSFRTPGHWNPDPQSGLAHRFRILVTSSHKRVIIMTEKRRDRGGKPQPTPPPLPPSQLQSPPPTTDEPNDADNADATPRALRNAPDTARADSPSAAPEKKKERIATTDLVHTSVLAPANIRR
ncbi:hypothetical protein CSUB01_12345, partial [Colletotrichum sublineola]